jgi:hypothetical protein
LILVLQGRNRVSLAEVVVGVVVVSIFAVISGGGQRRS